MPGSLGMAAEPASTNCALVCFAQMGGSRDFNSEEAKARRLKRDGGSGLVLKPILRLRHREVQTEVEQLGVTPGHCAALD
jgi:hypothetical protein